MVPTFDYGQASFEELYRGVQAFGSPEDKHRADELLMAHVNTGLGLDVALRLIRNAMMSLMAKVEWEQSFTEEAKKERQDLVRRNVGVLMGE